MTSALIAQMSPLLRVSVFFLVWLVVWLPVAIPCAIAVRWRPPALPTAAQKLPLVGTLYLLVLPLLWGFAWLEGVPFSSYGVSWTGALLVSLGVGLLIGVGGLLALFGIERVTGWLVWQPANWQQLGSAVLPTFAIGVWISLTEELIFRGFLLNQFQQTFSPWVAAIVSSAIFAILHLVWEGQSGVSQLPGLWLMGMVLVLARWIDRGSLGLAWGLHAGWIWAMASLDTASLLSYTGRAPDWLTGLAGKPLAGVMGIGFLLVTAIGLWWLGHPVAFF